MVQGGRIKDVRVPSAAWAVALPATGGGGGESRALRRKSRRLPTAVMSVSVRKFSAVDVPGPTGFTGLP